MLGPEMAWLVTRSALRLKEMVREQHAQRQQLWRSWALSKLLYSLFPGQPPWFGHGSLSCPLAVSLVSVPVIDMPACHHAVTPQGQGQVHLDLHSLAQAPGGDASERTCVH